MFNNDKNTVAGRREIVKQAIHENALEGITPDVQVQKLFAKYIDGKISLDDALQEITRDSVSVA